MSPDPSRPAESAGSRPSGAEDDGEGRDPRSSARRVLRDASTSVAGAFASTRKGGGLIIALGVALAVVHARHVVLMGGFVGTLLQAVVPLVLSLGISVVGTSVARGQWVEDVHVPRLLSWIALGMGTLVLSAFWMLHHHLLMGDLPAHVFELLANVTTVGAVVGIVTGTYDVRHRQTERTLQRTNERLEGFASVVSHDLRTPLATARGRLELLREDLPADDENVEAIDGALRRMDTIIDDILTLARSGDEVVEPDLVSLRDVVDRAWGVAGTEGATLEIEDDLGRVAADRNLAQQLLENLFRNAVEHGSTSPASQAHEDAVEHGSTSPASQAHEDAVEHGSTSPASQAHEDAVEHGSRVPSSRDREDGAALGSRSTRSNSPGHDRGSTSSQSGSHVDGGAQPGSTVTVSVGRLPDGFYVTDDGPGIPESDREMVFEQGFTTGSSTGLGLSIVREIAEAHGWTVTLSDQDDGSRFVFSGVDDESS